MIPSNLTTTSPRKDVLILPKRSALADTTNLPQVPPKDTHEEKNLKQSNRKHTISAQLTAALVHTRRSSTRIKSLTQRKEELQAAQQQAARASQALSRSRLESTMAEQAAVAVLWRKANGESEGVHFTTDSQREFFSIANASRLYVIFEGVRENPWYVRCLDARRWESDTRCACRWQHRMVLRVVVREGKRMELLGREEKGFYFFSLDARVWEERMVEWEHDVERDLEITFRRRGT